VKNICHETQTGSGAHPASYSINARVKGGSEWKACDLPQPNAMIQAYILPVLLQCPTRYQTRHSFNNSNTNEDIATKFEQEYVRCVRNEEKCVCSAPNCCDTEQNY